MKNYIRCPTEAEEQKHVMAWARLQSARNPELSLLFHVPNGGSRDAREAHNLRLQGVKSGVPDLMLPVARGKFHGLFIELKRTMNGRVSENQKGWIYALTNQGYYCAVCYGAEDAISTIQRYLQGKI